MSTLAEVQFHIYPTDCDMPGHLNHATLLNFLERARWALPDEVVLIEAVPKTSVGKFDKKVLRERFKSWQPKD